MRGIDYRAPQTGITLLIGKSFINAREADQGLKRVGRHKDACWRFAIEGIPLVDPLQRDRYERELLAFCRQLTPTNFSFKPLEEFKAPISKSNSKEKEKKKSPTKRSTPAGQTKLKPLT